MKQSDSLSPTMRDAVKFAMERGGIITRQPGGFWTDGDWKDRKWFGTTTIQALVRRGIMVYSKWQEGSRVRFPIEAQLTSNE